MFLHYCLIGLTSSKDWYRQNCCVGDVKLLILLMLLVISSVMWSECSRTVVVDVNWFTILCLVIVQYLAAYSLAHLRSMLVALTSEQKLLIELCVDDTVMMLLAFCDGATMATCHIVCLCLLRACSSFALYTSILYTMH